MLRSVPDEDFSRDSARRYHVRLLRHVPRSVHFARMRDALRDLDSRLRRCERVSAELTSFVIVVGMVQFLRTCGFVALRKMDGCDLEIVLRLA